MKIGIALDNTLNERWNKEIFFIRKKIEEEGGTFSYRTAYGLANSQFDNVRDMISNDDINVLVLVPVDGSSASAIVEYAHQHKVKVIAYSRPIQSPLVDFEVKFDVPAIGKKQVEYVTKKQPAGGNYLIIQGPTQDLNTQLLLQGQMEILQPFIDRNEVNLLDTCYLNGWTKLKAKECVSQVFAKQSEKIDVIVAANDMIAEAVYEYLEENKFSDILITGLDADVKACLRVAQNKQAMTIMLEAKVIANCVANTALYLSSGQDKFIEKYNVIEGQTKSIQLDALLIDAENVKEEVAAHKTFPLNWFDKPL